MHEADAGICRVQVNGLLPRTLTEKFSIGF